MDNSPSRIPTSNSPTRINYFVFSISFALTICFTFYFPTSTFNVWTKIMGA